jgi:hypothetical protein
MESHPQTCPACQNRFVPWNLGRVSTWSCIRCPHCNVALNRRRDLRFFVVFLLEIALITLVCNLSLPILDRALAALAVVLVGYSVDVLTVRLVMARQWRGIRGYAT